MYWLSKEKKRDPVRRWNLPDRIFFGRGACQILAGTYLEMPPLPGFHAEKIVPGDGFAGNHIYVTDGRIAFDYHGYSLRERLLANHWRGWTKAFPGWTGTIETVDFDLLDSAELNARKMLGPSQFLFDASQRARVYLERIDHIKAYEKAVRLRDKV